MQDQLAELTGSTTELAGYATDFAADKGPGFLLAIFTLVIGMWIVNRFVDVFGRTLEARKVEITLARFLRSLASVGLKVLLLISVAGMVGIETTSFIAVLGAAGLAVGLALQGSLANFAGGVLILLFRPYRVGEVISAQGELGTVNEIGILNTVLKTFDNKTVIIPNGILANGTITNMSMEQTRRVDWVFGVGYDDDIAKVREVLQTLLDADERILEEPATLIALGEFGDSSVNFVVRAWVNAGDLWPVFWDMNEKVKLAFDEAGISIPYPQRDVHLHQAAD
ncbi:MAG: mechanosensitive ion channel domain-containing protein [Pseudomonadales bacterium]|jgi:small conductance mechanosensitive channel|nr:mechanosensitive ion channel domain-containing protein [Pseudomonadales bacterium]